MLYAGRETCVGIGFSVVFGSVADSALGLKCKNLRGLFEIEMMVEGLIISFDEVEIVACGGVWRMYIRRGVFAVLIRNSIRCKSSTHFNTTTIEIQTTISFRYQTRQTRKLENGLLRNNGRKSRSWRTFPAFSKFPFPFSYVSPGTY